MRSDALSDGCGCFWHCRYFQSNLRRPMKVQYVKQIDAKLAKLK